MSKHFLIIANGPFLPAVQLKALAKGRIILALDGAADRLKKLKLLPDILLGDFDSLKNLNAWRKKNILIVRAPDQNKTDLEKAIMYCEKHRARSIDIACATDGRFDHTLSNLRLLKRKHRKACRITLHTKSQALIFLKNETFYLKGKVGEKLGLFGFPKGEVSSKGLKYELHQEKLAFAQKESVSNELKRQNVLLRIKGEILLVGPALDFLHLY